MPELPWVKWYPQYWSGDPALDLCQTSTRGIWADAINKMMLMGLPSLSGTDVQLSRLCRCSEIEMKLAIEDLKKNNVCDISIQNGCTTLTCRRILREHNIKSLRRKAALSRWCKHSANGLQDAHDFAYARSDSLSLSSSYSSVEGGGKGEGNFREAEIPSLEEVLVYADKIGLVEWKAKDTFDKLDSSGWKDKNGNQIVNWKSFFNRVRTWWEADGRPLSPVGRNYEESKRIKTPMDIKTIIQAKQSLASEIRNSYFSEVGLSAVWKDKTKRKEYFDLKKEIKTLNQQLSSMA